MRTMKRRVAQHRAEAARGSLLAVHCAWRKYGEPSAVVVAQFETHAELHKAEINAISTEGTLTPIGYNVSFGGETSPSLRPEVATKIGLSNRGLVKRKSEDVSVTSKALWQNPEYREKNIASVQEAWQREDLKAGASVRAKAMWEKRKAEGWSMPQETRQKLANCVVTEQARKRMSEAAKARVRAPRSEETKAKLSEAARRAWQDPELSARRVAAIKAAKAQNGSPPTA